MKSRLAKRASSSTKSKTDWDRLRSTEKGAATAEHPEFDPKHVVRGIVRRQRHGLRAMPHRPVCISGRGRAHR